MHNVNDMQSLPPVGVMRRNLLYLQLNFKTRPVPVTLPWAEYPRILIARRSLTDKQEKRCRQKHSTEVR